MDTKPQTTMEQATAREARLEAMQQAAAVVDQQQQSAKNAAAATLLAQQQTSVLVVHQQKSTAATLLPQQQATSLVAQHQAEVLAAQQQLEAAHAALAETTPTVPTGQPPTQNITFANTSGFALNLAMANQGILDYNTKEGRNVYETATRALSTVGYYCDPNGLYQELENL